MVFDHGREWYLTELGLRMGKPRQREPVGDGYQMRGRCMDMRHPNGVETLGVGRRRVGESPL